MTHLLAALALMLVVLFGLAAAVYPGQSLDMIDYNRRQCTRLGGAFAWGPERFASGYWSECEPMSGKKGGAR